MAEPVVHRLHAERALLATGWARDVAIEIDATGTVTRISSPSPPEASDERAAGPLLPAMPNLHSHAFQRAMAGLAEIAGAGQDSFWTWREEMYRTVGLLTPEDVEAIAAKLYVELLKGGFGAVAEFHYLHHGLGGMPYADPAELSKRMLRAANTAGSGLTLLPVFYAHSNFGGAAPTPGQSRFLHTVEGFSALLESLRPACAETGATLGLAFHSLRAATIEEMRAILAASPSPGPIHIHIAEQTKEVDDCLAWSGRRPVSYLLDEMPVDERWCLIHATHMQPPEISALARSGAVAGLCPATEANLGDGIFAATDYLPQGGRFGIGTDSHVATGVAEELKTLEYGQRLRDRRRNRLASGPGKSVGRSLFDAALKGGAQALGQPLGGIAVGNTASFVVLDGADPYIAAANDDQLLDRWLFALGDRVVRDVMVAGRWRIWDRGHAKDAEIDCAFGAVLAKLYQQAA
jgi:formimidoylglutamate deiminase